MNRRKFILTGLAVGAGAHPALADTIGGVRYNFGSAFSGATRARYGGKKTVDYKTAEKPGTIIIDTSKRRLFYVLKGGKAMSYGVGVGRQGFQWSGTAKIKRKAEWPGWRPPKEMIERERANGRELPEYMPGGPRNPLGARALYLFQGSRDTLYRIHGTNQPQTIGRAVSSGCIRMINEEVIDLYRRTRMGAKVIVL